MNMQITSSKIVISLLVFSIMLFLNAGLGLASEGLLDGKAFTGPTGKMGKNTSDDDELKFENGKLYSVGCADWGFGWGAYSTKVEGNSLKVQYTIYRD